MRSAQRTKSARTTPPVALDYAIETPTHHLANNPPNSPWYTTIGSAIAGIYISAIVLFSAAMLGYALVAQVWTAFGVADDRVHRRVVSIGETIIFALLTAHYLRRAIRPQTDSARAYWTAFAACHGLACAGMAIAVVRLLR